MKVLVCGGRDFNDEKTVFDYLDNIHRRTPIANVISGAARGADLLGEKWATSKGVSIQRFPANWDKLGKKAGFLRNQQMIDEGHPDLVIAFPGGRGTQDMVDRAKRHKIPVQQVVHPLRKEQKTSFLAQYR